MSEWYKLCDAFYTELKKNKKDRSVFELLKIFNKVRAEGDKVQQENTDSKKYAREMAQTIYDKTEGLMVAEQKLEAIRDILKDDFKSVILLKRRILGVLGDE